MSADTRRNALREWLPATVRKLLGSLLGILGERCWNFPRADDTCVPRVLLEG
jgi:hypothetical protein